MGKRGGAKKAPNSVLGSNDNISLREEITGKKQNNKGGTCNAKNILKVEHMERLAVWAGGEASMPCFAAFYGQKLASLGESLGLPPNPSLFACQRFVSQPDDSVLNHQICIGFYYFCVLFSF